MNLENLINLGALSGDARLRLDPAGAHVIAAPLEGGPARAWAVLPLKIPPLELTRTLTFDDISLIYSASRARFVLGGDDRWTFELDRFAGSPALSVSQSGSAVTLVLSGARFPGTEIPADLTARIYRHRTHGWALELQLAWGGFRATLGLRPFLEGSTAAAAPVALDGVACPLDADHTITTQGLGVALFRPSWTLAAAGAGIVHLRGYGPDVVRHLLTVALLAPGMAGLMLAPPDRRSALFVGVDQPFALDFWPTVAGELEFSAAQPPFRWLAVEAGEDAAGPRRLLAAAGDLASTLEFTPSPELRRVDGQPYRIPLDRPIFVALYGPAPALLARGLLAQLGDDTRDLHTPRVSLLLGRPRDHRPFVLGQVGDQRALTCELTWLAHAARPGGLVADPLPQADTRLRFVLADAPAPSPERGEVRLHLGAAPVTITSPVAIRLRLLRPRDLLQLTYELLGLRLVAAGDTADLQRAAAAATLVVHFQPQTLGEESIYEADGDTPHTTLPDPPVLAYLSEPTRLAFTLRSDAHALPYDLHTLLAWDDPRLAPKLAPAATPVDVGPIQIRAPRADETSIEPTFRLILSPDASALWRHAEAPVERAGRTELWHTRLLRRPTRGPRLVRESRPVLRAIWTLGHPNPPQNPGPGPDGMVMSLTPDERTIVVSQSVHSDPPHADLMLSALGAWLDLDARWPDESLQIATWVHRATMGRDHYVRVVRRGFLFPYGHRAVLIAITERKVQQRPLGRLGAYLRRREFIVVREPELDYQPDFGVPARYPYQGRETPLLRLRILDRTTPNLDLDTATPRWLRVGGQDHLLRLRAWDREGRAVDFTAPVAFIPQPAPGPGAAATIKGQVDAANAVLLAQPARARRPLHGQRLAFAPIARAGDTTFEVESLTVTAKQVHWQPGDLHRPCLPFLREAALVLPALRHFGGDATATAVVYHPPYLSGGFDGKGELFLATKSPPPMRFGGARSTAETGALVTPNLAVGGVSRVLGLTGEGLGQIDGGTFDPATYFGSALGAKLLGGVTLSDILSAVGFTGSAGAGKIPQWAEVIDGPRRRFELTWRTDKLKSAPPFVPRGGAALEISAVAELATDGDVRATTSATLRAFAINLFDVIEIVFDHVTFLARPGAKPDVDVAVTDVNFLGALAFVQKITDYLSLDGFKDPPSIDVSAAGIRVGYTLAVPAITVGVFSLQNLRLGAEITLPFDGSPLRARFALSSRDDPFTITVMIFGGSGFFAVAVGLDGVEGLEVQLEFGGNWALDFGVASGGVYAMAGIYIGFDGPTDTTTLTGYVRAGGHLSVLGIVSISLEFYLGLTYQKVGDSGRAWGEARMTFEVEVLFFSVGFTAEVRREFAGSSHARTFQDALAPDEWAEYCDAFAL
jgi:hypothetical protein